VRSPLATAIDAEPADLAEEPAVLDLGAAVLDDVETCGLCPGRSSSWGTSSCNKRSKYGDVLLTKPARQT
jgi:hypothetical protein